MRKKFAAFWATLVLCLLVALPAFAAKPALQAYVTFNMNSVGGVSTTIHYRNNTGKTIKYIHWYMSPYNAVNDKVKSEIGNYAYGNETGPIAPFSTKLEQYGDNYAVLDGSLYSIRSDSNGCPYIYQNGQTYYLTETDVNNYAVNREAYFECMWYNWAIDHIVLDKAVIIYMDGSQQTVSGSSMTMNNYGAKLQRDSFENEKTHYADVYNYTEYKNYNPDLVATLGDEEHKYIEHFISSGMKEGRRGKYEFDLAAYKANNPDLVALYGDDNQKYYEHYISSGKNEGRSAIDGMSKDIENLDRVYDYNSYRHYNPDLIATLGDDKEKYLEHFLTTGMKEGRRGSYEFDLAAYKANNPDLVAIYGDDNQKYYEHYISKGKDEGRVATEEKAGFEITNWNLVWNKEPTYYKGYDRVDGTLNFEIDYRNNTAWTIKQVQIYFNQEGSEYVKMIVINDAIQPQTEGHAKEEITTAFKRGPMEITRIIVFYTDGAKESISPATAVTSGVTKLSMPE